MIILTRKPCPPRPKRAPPSRFSALLGSRQINPETASFADFRFDTTSATHALHGTRHDGQTNAGARITLRRLATLEYAEDFLMRSEGNANAFIPHPNPDLVEGRNR